MLKRDVAESIANMAIGAAVNWFAVLFLFGVSFSFATLSTFIFFGLSFIRSLVIRRMFRWHEAT